MKWGAAILFVVFGCACLAQEITVQGKVTDLVTGLPIDSATVTAIDSRDAKRVTLSGHDGTYKIEHLSKGESIRVSCSQLGYSPNPKNESVREFSQGTAIWNPRLVQENGNVAYLNKVLDYLASSDGSNKREDAAYIAVNMTVAKRSLIAAKMDVDMRFSKESTSSAALVSYFRIGRTSDNSLRNAILGQVYWDPAYRRQGRLDHFNVVVVNGHVTVFGNVPNQTAKESIANLASQFPSAVGFDNRLIVKPDNSQN